MQKKILILSHKPPYPKTDGGSIAMSQFLESCLDAGHQVDYLSMSTHKHKSKNPPYAKGLKYKSILVDTRIKPIPLILNYFFSKESYILSRFKNTRFKNELLNILKKNNYHTVVFESLFTALYCDDVLKNSKAKQVYRSHNVEYLIWEHKSQHESNYFLNKYYKHQAKRLKKEEMNLWRKFEDIASISDADTKHISKYCNATINTLGFTGNIANNNQATAPKSIDFFHIGAMDWQPNIEAMKWLSTSIWPKFVSTNSSTSLHIAGRAMSHKFKASQIANCTIYGEVASAENFMNEHVVMVIPLLSGSGIRIKIIEGLALGKCIIGTDLAFMGIPIKDRKNALIANTTEEFVEAMNFCANNPKEVFSIAENARSFAKENFSLSAYNKTLENIL